MGLYQIDATDRKIINLLTSNARTPFLEIARFCGVSGAAIHQRVAKLEKSGVLSGSQFKLAPEVLGYNTCAYLGVHLEKAGLYQSVLEELKKIPEIIECHYTTGQYALFVKLYCRDNRHLMELLNHQIQQIQGVSSTETFISLEESINRQVEA